jgi:hypothetical protein
MDDNLDAWRWMEGDIDPDPQSKMDGLNIARCFARVFAHHDANYVLQHLRSTTRDRVFGPDISDATLRYVEGQRALVAYMEKMIRRGKDNSLQNEN